MQRRVLFQNFVNRRADAVFVRARLGLDRKCDRRLGNAAADNGSARLLSPSVSPVSVSFSFATAPRSPACNLGTRRRSCPASPGCAGSASARAAREVLQRRVVLQHAGHHLEIADAPGERIGQRLVHEDRHRLGVIVSCAPRVGLCRCLSVSATCARSSGCGKHLRDEVSMLALPILCSAELSSTG